MSPVTRLLRRNRQSTGSCSILTGETGPAGQLGYTYDAVGNRLTKVADGTTTAYSYDRADRILTAGGVTYTSDPNGNITARGSETFSYDQANRLTAYSRPGTTVSYVYDGDGKRTRRTVNGTPTNYVYDIKATVPRLMDDGERRYVWRPTLAYALSTTIPRYCQELWIGP